MENNAASILEELANLYRERNAVYKDNWKDIGPVMEGFFPRGITLTTAQDHIRFHLFMLAAVKLTRYCNNWEKGHSDSLRDASVYSAMLDAADMKPGVIKSLDPIIQALMRIADPQNHTASGATRRQAKTALWDYCKRTSDVSLLHPEDGEWTDSEFHIWLDSHRIKS